MRARVRLGSLMGQSAVLGVMGPCGGLLHLETVESMSVVSWCWFQFCQVVAEKQALGSAGMVVEGSMMGASALLVVSSSPAHQRTLHARTTEPMSVAV